MKRDYVYGFVILSVIIIVVYLSRKPLESVANKLIAGLSTDTIKSIVLALKKYGVNDPLIIAGIISEIFTESKFVPKTESSYSKTSNDRIKQIFGKYVSDLTEQQLTALKANDEKFFNKVYGNRMGNSATEGYKFRGRGLNQLTGKANYQKFAQLTGYDIVTNPDLVNSLPVAVSIAAAFFSEGLKALKPTVKNTKDATKAALQINAGLGTDINSTFLKSVNDKQMSVIDSIYSTVKNVA